MRVLAINNYSLDESLKDSRKGIYPRHHCWGIDYMLDKGHKVDTMLFKPPQNCGLFRKCMYAMIFNLKLWRKINEYDVVIAFANPIIAMIAILKKIGWVARHTKLYTMVHHYERLTLLSTGYEKIFFLSKNVMAYTAHAYPTLMDRFEYLVWGGDIPFYEPYFKSMGLDDAQKPDVLMMNGKTARDVELFTDVCEGMCMPFIVITDKADRISGKDNVLKSGVNGQNALSYHDMLSMMKKVTVSVIPVVTDKSPTSLTGLTSFVDAVILGTPIIMSDNTNISINIEALEMGYTYRAGDMEDLEKKIRLMVSDKDKFLRMSRNCRAWAMKNDYQKYCRQLYSCIFPDSL